MSEPCYDIAHLGHVELLSNRFEESLDFFTRVYGLKESGREGDSVYLRAWDDYEFHTLKLTRSETTGIGHVAYRASSEAALMRRVKAIEASRFKSIGWVDGDLGHGHGKAFRFEDPFGHVFEIYWDTRVYEPAPEDARRSRIWPAAIMGRAAVRAGSITSIFWQKMSPSSVRSWRHAWAAASPR